MSEGYRDKILIIIPAYNEADTIEATIEALRQEEISRIADFVIINDGSSDDTAAIVERLGAPVVSHVYNLGYGSALWTGYKYAVRNGYGSVIQMDADGQHDPCNILQIYKLLNTPDENGKYPDIVLGSRFMEGSAPYHQTFMRLFAIRLFRGIIRIATGQRITDPTSCLQGFCPRVVLYYAKFSHFDDQYPDANMLMQMLLLGFRVKEYPAVMHQRLTGTSMHSGLKPIIYMLRMSICLMAAWARVRLYKVDEGITVEE